MEPARFQSPVRRAQSAAPLAVPAGSLALLATGRLPPLTSADFIALGARREGGDWGGVLCRSCAGEPTRRPTGATHCASVHTGKKKEKKRREKEKEERNSWGRSSALAADDIT